MSTLIQAIRGMNDILPEETPYWLRLEDAARHVLNQYGYQQIRLPVLEKTELFKRSIGEVTDIVEKEMYTFEDRNGDSLTLRPEGTAGCVRAVLENSLLQSSVQRLWYGGPMFRHERPQKGRYRQFHQIGVEVFGIETPDIDAELIVMTARLWRELGLLEGLELQINSLGECDARAAYRNLLVEYFTQHQAQLDEDSQRRLLSNPLRILDSKNPALQDLIGKAPRLNDHLDDESRQHFERLCALLENAGINYVINPRLVRGLDYYGRTVFEWVTTQLGAQGTVCAGGRYDGLVEQLGGKPTPAVGFAMGLERLIALLQDKIRIAPAIDAYMILSGADAETAGLKIAEQLREVMPGLALQMHCGGGSFKSQFKKADKSGARLAIVLGDTEVANNTAGIKFLREDTAQLTVEQSALAATLQELMQ